MGLMARSIHKWARGLGAVVFLFGLLFPLAVSAQANTLIETWSGVQQVLGNPEESGKLGPALQRLLEEKKNLALRRIPSFSRALSSAAAEAGDQEIRRLLLRGAKEMDPLLPSPRFLSAKDEWAQGQIVGALGEFSTGVLNLFRDQPTRRLLGLSIVPWLCISLLLGIGLTMLLFDLRFIRLIIMDALHLAGKMFGSANALVLALVIVVLPLCGGLGLVWELVFLFVLTWSYIKFKERIAGIVMLFVLFLVMPALNIWTQSMLVTPPLGDQVREMLEKRQGNFSVLRAFTELTRDLDKSAAFHVVSGELLRMHGDRELALLEFEKVAMLAPKTSLPKLYLGALALEERDTARALEYLNDAISKDPKNVLAHYDLAIALDLTRRFEEGDSARHKARELSGGHYERIGLPGRGENVLFPRLGARMVQRVVQDASGFSRISLTGGGRSIFNLEYLLEPISIAALFGLLFGPVVLVIRRRFFPPGRECTKCGKVFYPEDKTVYCEQCVTVFLKRNAVSIEQQSAKVSAVRRWDLFTSSCRRLAGVVCPGGALTASGRCVAGLLLSLVVIVPLLGALMWVPLYGREVESLFPWLALQAFLALIGIGLWVSLAVSAWYRR